MTSSNPFVDLVGGILELIRATVEGAPLPSPYNMDMTGATRGADGVWDLGAYEFWSGSTPSPIAPAPPTNLSLVVR